jgi:hypothetical protein
MSIQKNNILYDIIKIFLIILAVSAFSSFVLCFSLIDSGDLFDWVLFSKIYYSKDVIIKNGGVDFYNMVALNYYKNFIVIIIFSLLSLRVLFSYRVTVIYKYRIIISVFAYIFYVYIYFFYAPKNVDLHVSYNGIYRGDLFHGIVMPTLSASFVSFFLFLFNILKNCEFSEK